MLDSDLRLDFLPVSDRFSHSTRGRGFPYIYRMLLHVLISVAP